MLRKMKRLIIPLEADRGLSRRLSKVLFTCPQSKTVCLDHGREQVPVKVAIFVDDALPPIVGPHLFGVDIADDSIAFGALKLHQTGDAIQI